jgi:hypothetical protein
LPRKTGRGSMVSFQRGGKRSGPKRGLTDFAKTSSRDVSVAFLMENSDISFEWCWIGSSGVVCEKCRGRGRVEHMDQREERRVATLSADIEVIKKPCICPSPTPWRPRKYDCPPHNKPIHLDHASTIPLHSILHTPYSSRYIHHNHRQCP